MLLRRPYPRAMTRLPAPLVTTYLQPPGSPKTPPSIRGLRRNHLPGIMPSNTGPIYYHSPLIDASGHRRILTVGPPMPTSAMPVSPSRLRVPVLPLPQYPPYGPGQVETERSGALPSSCSSRGRGLPPFHPCSGGLRAGPEQSRRPISPLRRRRGLRSSTPVRLSGAAYRTFTPTPTSLSVVPLGTPVSCRSKHSTPFMSPPQKTTESTLPLPDLYCTFSNLSTPVSAARVAEPAVQADSFYRTPPEPDAHTSYTPGSQGVRQAVETQQTVRGEENSDDESTGDDDSSGGSTVVLDENRWQVIPNPITPIVPKLVLPKQPALFGIAHYRAETSMSSQSRQNSTGILRSPGPRSPLSSKLSPGSRRIAEQMRHALRMWATSGRTVARRVSVSFPLDIELPQMCRVFSGVPPASSRKTSGRLLSDRASSVGTGRHRHQRVFSLFVETVARLTRERTIYSDDAADMLVCWLKRRNIRVLAVDFDNTITRQHSGGCVDIDSKVCVRLWRSLAPDMNALGVAAEQAGVPVACVSFSDAKMTTCLFLAGRERTLLAGDELINLFFQKSGASFSLAKIYSYYPRLYQNRQVFRELQERVGVFMDERVHGMPRSKEFHLFHLCQDFGVLPEEVLLIDDDATNVAEAASAGYMVLHVKKGLGLSFTSMSGEI
eukprot:Gregarina_sp_Poly_1__4633@NODE_247_length_10750_cov_169_692315_g217_i0_p2_GENE_NODE_247_length_10750_cov_169_692315_g217_i0NODE_247_length_10750_cov_169_692315_g217_i0_p2_ORF_typecomplete_len663_score69_78Acid_PPase/PF12689_7/0_0032HAD_2/PF13419_6/4_3e03HAD_2/PF13419_6/1_2e04HAD_2/PF13419_6/0_0063PGP_phosphatase/PF09419_10/0_053_NODE_247_length_10750_cov_169_692315_g217_i013543342